MPRLVRELLGRLLAVPPPLAAAYTQRDYYRFMRCEVSRYSRHYARRRVAIHNAAQLPPAGTGAALAFLHFGSFFLAGGAIVHQLGLPYSAMVSRRNLRLEMMPAADIGYWQWVHGRAASLYGQPLIFSDESPRKALAWVKAGNLLGLALDVREYGQPHKEDRFTFLGQTIYMQTGPARFAALAQVPLIPMTIRYDASLQMHDLSFFDPVWVGGSAGEATQRVLNSLAEAVRQCPPQQFHDVASSFRTPASQGSTA